MMSTGRSSTKFPFTATQWQELEHQALVFKYMISGMPIPPDLLYSIRRSLDSSKLILHQSPQHIGWNCFQMDFGRKIDPEPGRCRRTDGKKWRCSKEAYPDSKYCERHMHRGRNRSRKPVESSPAITTSSATVTVTAVAASPNKNNTSRFAPTAIPISSSSITNSKDSSSHRFPFSSQPSSQTSISTVSFGYPHSSSSSRPPGLVFSPQDSTTNFLVESSPYSPVSAKDNRNRSYGEAVKNEVVGEHCFLTDAPSDSWHLTVGSPVGHLNHQQPNYMQQNEHDLHQRPKKVMHHFFDEWPPKQHKDSWEDNSNDVSLSISMSNSARDFFLTQSDK